MRGTIDLIYLLVTFYYIFFLLIIAIYSSRVLRFLVVYEDLELVLVPSLIGIPGDGYESQAFLWMSLKLRN